MSRCSSPPERPPWPGVVPAVFDHVDAARGAVDWLAKHQTSKAARTDYRDRHLLETVPDDLDGFNAWFTARRKRMAVRLKEILG